MANIAYLDEQAYKSEPGVGWNWSGQAQDVREKRAGQDIDEKRKAALAFLQQRAQGQPQMTQMQAAQQADATRAQFAGASNPAEQRQAMMRQAATQAAGSQKMGAAAAQEMQGQQASYIKAAQQAREQEIKDMTAMENLAAKYMAMGFDEKNAKLQASIQHQRDRLAASGIREGINAYEAGQGQQIFGSIMGGVGAALGAYGAMGSDKYAKTNIKPELDVLKRMGR
jgi:hypothetical protein